MMSSMNTNEIEKGSMFVNDPTVDTKPPGNAYVERFLVKWYGHSHLHVSWEVRGGRGTLDVTET